ncbi:MFS transporter [Lacticaseibacillus parakribbianus]|uniref:MFS transporter n=1 Tax=Lacticaseibacillus parakribbianus TaxID=2970927 RepID=UPI0021CB3D48|nr:MFS transporter [Lacticaseibacillus parakribbianus]
MRKLSAQTIKILIIRFAGTFGSGMLSFAIGLYILQRTGSALGMGISLITGPLVSLCLTPVLGYIVDTKNHRAIMVLAQLGTTLGLIAFAAAFALWPAAYYQELIALIVLLQITDSFLSTTLTASLVQLFAKTELQSVNSLNQSLQSLASFLAPVIGALVYTLVAIGSFALIEVGFELIALVGILTLNFHAVPAAASEAAAESMTAAATGKAPAEPTAEPAATGEPTAATATAADAEGATANTADAAVTIEAATAPAAATTAAAAEAASEAASEPAATTAKPSLWRNFAEGFHFLLDRPIFLLLTATGAAINFFFAALNVGLPYVLVHTLHLSNTQYGWTDSAFAVGMFLGGLLLSQITLRHHPIDVSYAFLLGLSLLMGVLGLPTLTGWGNGVNTGFYLVLNALQGILLVFVNTPLSTYMQQLIPANMQGRVFSLQSALSMMLMPLGTLLYGVLFDHVAAFWLMTGTGVILIALVLAAMAAMRKFHLLAGLPTFAPDAAEAPAASEEG